MGAQPSPSNTRRHTGGHHLSRHHGLSVKDSSAGGIFRGGTYLRGDKKPAVTQNPTSAGSNPANAKIYSRFTLRDLMLHGNAPLAQLRSPLRRANSMENGATKFSSPTFQTSQKKQTPRTLKKLMRTVDRENRAPEESTLGPPETSYRVTTRVPKTRTAWLVSDGNLVCSGGARASSLTVVPGTTTKSGKRKATPETPEDFSFFVSEINSIGGTSLRERELVDALADVKAAALASRASASLGRWRLAVAIQKANAKVFEKTQTLQEMLRDQAHEFDTEKSSRRAELRAVLDADCALQKTHRETQLKLAEADENVEVLTEALGAASREKWETTWRLAAKAALGNKRASDSRRKLRRVMLALFANIGCYISFSLGAEERLIDKIQAAAFVNPKDQAILSRRLNKDVKATVYDFKILLQTFLGIQRSQQVLAHYALAHHLSDNNAHPEPEFIAYCERALTARAWRIVRTSINTYGIVG